MKLSETTFKKYMDLNNESWIIWSKKLIKYGYLNENNLSIWQEGWQIFSKLKKSDQLKNQHLIEKLFQLLEINKRIVPENIFDEDYLIKKKNLLIAKREILKKNGKAEKERLKRNSDIKTLIIEFNNINNSVQNHYNSYNNYNSESQKFKVSSKKKIIDTSINDYSKKKNENLKETSQISTKKSVIKSIKKKSIKHQKKKQIKPLKVNKKKSVSDKQKKKRVKRTQEVISKKIRKLNSNKSYIDSIKNIKKESTREGIIRGLIEVARRNKKILALTADLKHSFYLDRFETRFPERFYEFGISEQNMLAAAAGMSLNNKIPFVFSFAVFNPGRNWDQLRVSIAYQNSNVKIVGGHSGLETGKDGGTHQALEDIALTRVLPNLTVVSPCDMIEARKVVKASLKIKGPIYIRISREKFITITDKDTEFEFGKGIVFDYGKDITIISTGITTQIALKARKKLFKQDGIKASVIHLHTIKPLDKELILKYAKLTKVIVTIEDHQISCGLGSAVAELVAENYPIPILRVGVKDKFGQSGDGIKLLNMYGINQENLINVVKKAIKIKSNFNNLK